MRMYYYKGGEINPYGEKEKDSTIIIIIKVGSYIGKPCKMYVQYNNACFYVKNGLYIILYIIISNVYIG